KRYRATGYYNNCQLRQLLRKSVAAVNRFGPGEIDLISGGFLAGIPYNANSKADKSGQLLHDKRGRSTTGFSEVEEFQTGSREPFAPHARALIPSFLFCD